MSKHFIPLDLAIQMTTKYRNHRETILDPSYRNKNVLAICESFDRSEFDTVLAQEGCTGLRVYFGMDEEDLVKVIVVGTNAKGEDMLPAKTESAARSATTADGDDDDQIIELGSRCPTQCPPPSSLNP